MADTPRGPTHVQRVLDFISPKIGDFLFYERVKAELVQKPTGQMPADYGGAHGKASVYPDHKMVAIKPDSEEGWVRVYYAKERADQEDYNYEVDAPLDDDWPRLTQTWVILRSAYTGPGMAVTAPPALGQTWTRTGDVERRTGDEITDSLFVILRVFYRDISVTLVDWDIDEETRDEVRIQRRIVAGMSNPGASVGEEVTQIALGTGFSLRTTREINSGSAPTNYQYYDWIDYTFPNLLTNIITYTFGGEFQFEPVVRSAYTKKVRARIEVSFHTTQPSPSELFQLQPIDIHYKGFTFQIHESSVITNEWDIFNTPTEEYTTQESDPTYSEYNALIGDEVLINERVTRWRYGYFRRMLVYITLE